MKKFLVILVLFAAACGSYDEPVSEAATETVAPQLSAEELANAKRAAEERARNLKRMEELWTKIQAGPPTEPDWKAQLDGKSASDTVLCQVIWFERAINDFNFHRDKATPEELQRIKFSETLLAEQKRARAQRFISLAFENAKEGRTVSCPEAGTYEPYDLVASAIADMKEHDIEPKELNLDIDGIRAIELAAIKSRATELRKTMYEPGGEGAGHGRDIFLGALDKGFAPADLGLTAEEAQKMRDLGNAG